MRTLTIYIPLYTNIVIMLIGGGMAGISQNKAENLINIQSNPLINIVGITDKFKYKWDVNI